MLFYTLYLFYTTEQYKLIQNCHVISKCLWKKLFNRAVGSTDDSLLQGPGFEALLASIWVSLAEPKENTVTEMSTNIQTRNNNVFITGYEYLKKKSRD